MVNAPLDVRMTKVKVCDHMMPCNNNWYMQLNNGCTKRFFCVFSMLNLYISILSCWCLFLGCTFCFFVFIWCICAVGLPRFLGGPQGNGSLQPTNNRILHSVLKQRPLTKETVDLYICPSIYTGVCGCARACSCVRAHEWVI